MSILAVVIVLVIIGVLLWLLNTYVPMDARIKTILNVFVIIAVLLWLIVKFVAPLLHGL